MSCHVGVAQQVCFDPLLSSSPSYRRVYHQQEAKRKHRPATVSGESRSGRAGQLNIAYFSCLKRHSRLHALLTSESAWTPDNLTPSRPITQSWRVCQVGLLAASGIPRRVSQPWSACLFSCRLQTVCGQPGLAEKSTKDIETLVASNQNHGTKTNPYQLYKSRGQRPKLEQTAAERVSPPGRIPILEGKLKIQVSR
jgi:hypothetical protein